MAEKRPIESFEQAHEIGKEFKRIYDLLNLKSPDKYGLTPYKINYTNPNGTIAYSQIDYFSQTFVGGSQGYYIRFGKFLSFLQNKIIPNIKFDLDNKRELFTGDKVKVHQLNNTEYEAHIDKVLDYEYNPFII